MTEGNLWDGLIEDFADLAGGGSEEIKRSRQDLAFFSEYIMGYESADYRPPSDFLGDIYETLQFSDEKRILILGPRNSAKSQATTVNYPLWRLGRNPLMRFLLVFAAKEVQGHQFSNQIASVIERNERYKEAFGDLFPRNAEWSKDRRTVERQEPPGGLKGASITLAGFGSNLPSMRADEIIIDDIVTQENAYSPTIQDQIESFVFRTLLPILEPEGRLIVVGSRWDSRDLYARLADRWELELPEPDPRINLDAILEASRGEVAV